MRRYRDYCDFSKWQPPPSWIFQKNWYFNDMSAVRGQHASPCQISSTSVKSLHTYGFLNGGRPPSCICWARLGPPPMTTWWSLTLYRCAKFGLNRCSSFDNIKLSMFCTFGLKTPIHAPKVGLLEEIGSYIKKTKRHTLARVRVVWAIKRENPSTGLTCSL